MRTVDRRVIGVLLVAVGSVALASCVDEEAVFGDRPIFQGVAVEAGGFVGYVDPSNGDKLTVCGACHGSEQGEWEGTGHAGAWADLQRSDNVRAFCEACHTVNSLGNIVVETEPGVAVGGHAAVDDPDGRYRDVQCESCHGPGLDHALAPGKDNIPLAPIQVGADLSFGCGECHQGTHHPFVDEWERSPHADVELAPAIRAPFCSGCHTGEGALVRMGVTADYLGKDALLASAELNAPITCAVCHDPHSAEHEGQLRFPLGGVAVEQSLCAQCHNRHPRPDTRPAQAWLLPHSPETGLLAGAAGWFPPGSSLTPGEVKGPHGGASNPRLCGSCHVVPFTVTDELTDMEFHSAGHGFRAMPCVDANGLPSGETECALTPEARSFAGCLECHDSEASAAERLQVTTMELVGLVRELRGLLFDVDPNLQGSGGEIDEGDGRFTVAEGALFNMSLAVHGGGFPSDTRRLQLALAPTAMHNPVLIRTLLAESIAAMRAAYP